MKDAPESKLKERARALLSSMTLREKIGQLSQVHASDGYPPDYLAEDLRAGRIGSVINQVNVDAINELQRLAVEESRLGIPLLIGRDVIHGFRTIFPIPLGQSAAWHPELVEQAAAVAAREAASVGINWTFAPMVDLTRDPRWGRIAESFGEDVYLGTQQASAMVRGFQGSDLSDRDTVAACVKHFAGYGACESGRDYATTNIPEHELRNIYLPPFKAGIDAGAATLMTSFSDLNGVPATGNPFLLRQILRDEWQFTGMVVSDWDSVRQLSVHGLTENDGDAACEAMNAGVDMEMAGDAYANHLEALLDEGRVALSTLDQAVTHILTLKLRLGLFERPYVDTQASAPLLAEDALTLAHRLARQSLVLLKNERGLLPLKPTSLRRLAVIGPLADDPYEQLGTWVFDGQAQDSVTPLAAMRAHLGDAVELTVECAMAHSRSHETSRFERAAELARAADAALLFLGEESLLSGEAHCRADINLPGAQAELVARVRASGTPVVAVVMAGRPLTLENILDQVDALIFAWHPGTMGGPAIADVLFGVESPSGRLPVSFPRMVGQVPIYYNLKRGGKPASPETVVHVDDIEPRAAQTSFGMTSFHLDAGYQPLFPFGFGLTYSQFEYRQFELGAATLRPDEVLHVQAEVVNTGAVTAVEVVQLYVRDCVGQVTRPVRELKGFQRVRLAPGEAATVRFELPASHLAFYGRDHTLVFEPGNVDVWIGSDSTATLGGRVRLMSD